MSAGGGPEVPDEADETLPTVVGAEPVTLGTADLLASFRRRFAAEHVRLDEVLAVLGRRGFAGLLLVLVAPQFLPWPLGMSQVLAVLLLPVAGQMAVGRRQVWLPGWLLARQIPRGRLLRVAEALVPVLRRLERVVRPRTRFVATPWGERVIGLCALVLAVALMVPVPLVSWLTAFALVVLSLGLIERDGLAVLAGVGLGAAAVAILFVAAFGMLHLGGLLLG